LIYRAVNAHIVQRLIEGVPAQWEVHLWALDRPHPLLLDATRATGPGGKFELLQKLIDAHSPAPDSWMVFSDDDYLFRRGGLGELLAIANAADLDVAQPAHRRPINHGHDITVVRPRTIARRTHFVEIGPVFAASPRAVEHVLPFPRAAMGWGIEALWARKSFEGAISMGIVDAVTIDHLQPPGRYYDMAAARAERDEFVSRAGFTSLRDPQITLGRWRRLSGKPSWKDHDVRDRLITLDDRGSGQSRRGRAPKG
jgi:hypothetical protein